jgi:hypothetical protein
MIQILGGAGLCGSVGIQSGFGIASQSCLNANGNHYVAVVLSFGVQAGASYSLSPYTLWFGKDESLSWDWAIEDRIGGVSRYALELSNIKEVPYSSCSTYLPLSSR